MRVVISGAEVFDADDARIGAVGSDRHDVVAVTQVLGVGMRRARRRGLVLDERGGHLFGRSGAQVSRSVHVTGFLAIVRGDIRANVPVQQRDSRDQGHGGGNRQAAGNQEQAVAAHGRHRLVVWTTVPPDALGYRCQVRQRHPVPSGSAASAVSAASSPGNTPPSHPVARVQRSRRWRASRRNAASSCVSVWDWRW